MREVIQDSRLPSLKALVPHQEIMKPMGTKGPEAHSQETGNTGKSNNGAMVHVRAGPSGRSGNLQPGAG